MIQQQPTFGLHDSTGISLASYFAVLMLDTTDPTGDSILHYLHGEFQADGRTKADLSSQIKPLVSYHAPGTLGEASGPRHYTFLLYEQSEGAGLDYDDSLSLLDGFDQELFESDNGLSSPIAGLAISVDIDASYDGGDHSGEGSPTSNHPPHTTPNKSITTTKVIGGGDSSEPTRTSLTSTRSLPTVWTVSGVVMSGYTPDAIPFTTSTAAAPSVPGAGGKAMVTEDGAGAQATAGAAPAAGFSRGDGTGGQGMLTSLMVTLGGAIAVAIVLM